MLIKRTLMDKHVLTCATALILFATSSYALETKSEQYIREKQERGALIRENALKRLDRLRQHREYNVQSGISVGELNNLEPTTGPRTAETQATQAPQPHIIRPPATGNKPAVTPADKNIPSKQNDKILNSKGII